MKGPLTLAEQNNGQAYVICDAKPGGKHRWRNSGKGWWSCARCPVMTSNLTYKLRSGR
jgi:hypothetical protein